MMFLIWYFTGVYIVFIIEVILATMNSDRFDEYDIPYLILIPLLSWIAVGIAIGLSYTAKRRKKNDSFYICFNTQLLKSLW